MSDILVSKMMDTPMETTQNYFGIVESGQTKKIILLERRKLSSMLRVITGNTAESAECRACVKEDETQLHYLRQCSAFSRLRRDILHDSVSFKRNLAAS